MKKIATMVTVAILTFALTINIVSADVILDKSNDIYKYLPDLPIRASTQASTFTNVVLIGFTVAFCLGSIVCWALIIFLFRKLRKHN